MLVCGAALFLGKDGSIADKGEKAGLYACFSSQA